MGVKLSVCELKWKICLKILKMEPGFGSLETELKRNTAEVSIEMKMSLIDLLDIVGCLCILGYTS